MLSTLSEMTLNSTTFSLKPVYCVCQSVLTFLAGLCQRDVLLYEPLQHQVSCWMLCHVKLQRAQRAQRIKHKVTIKASFSEYPSKKKKILSYSYLLFVDTFVLGF